MNDRVEDKLAISDLMTGWMHRDLSQWDQLRGLFHADARMEIAWFEGPAGDFVDASERMGHSDLRSKHLIANPVVTFHGDKAVVETNAVLIGENIQLNLGFNVHNRFIDRVEKRDGRWGIVHRCSVYDHGTFTFPLGLIDIEGATVAKYPREYAALAYVLEKSGYPVNRVFPTKGSDLERDIRNAAARWLTG
nr:Bile acid 7-alpha dehydratase BaiE (EC 4.2.1.106) [Kibdelosporangium sp. MJ126-NF4]